ncbi:hypothetical protein BKA69DRAFT_1125403 [Paraphysoderma sedebokerense]|nr:hypothetical protein BKA69DRAFT_1125403 [Paraphysoderma sedebokerense]
MVLACPVALMNSHSKCEVIDHENISELEAKFTIATSSSSLTENAYILLVMFYLHLGQYENAKEWAEKGIKLWKESYWMASFLGWICLLNDNGGFDAPAFASGKEWFDNILEKNPRNVDALLGRSHYYRYHSSHVSNALDALSQIIVFNPTFLPALIEDMFCTFQNADAWDQLNEKIQRIASVKEDCIDACWVDCFIELVKNGNTKDVKRKMNILVKAVNRSESANPQIMLSIIQSFSRLPGQQECIADTLVTLAEQLVKLNPKNANYKCELAFLKYQQGQIETALSIYNNALRMDPDNLEALEGLIRCEFSLNRFDSVTKEFELLKVIQQSSGTSAMTLYLSAVLAWKKSGNAELRLKYLNDAIQCALSSATDMLLSFDYYVALNTYLLLTITREISPLLSPEDMSENDNQLLEDLTDAFDLIVKVVPACVEALYGLATTKFWKQDIVKAKKYVEKCIAVDSGYFKAHLQMAQIHLHGSQPKSALQSLDTALSQNFEIRSNFSFHVLKGKSLKMLEMLEDASASLKTAGDILERGGVDYSMSDILSYYSECMEVYSKLTNYTQASKIIQEAFRKYQRTPIESKITLLNADLYIHKQEYDKALDILGSIDFGKKEYIASRKRTADIYLKYKNDKKAYLQICKEIAERTPSVETYSMLGDAYLNNNEASHTSSPEKAISTFEDALNVFGASEIASKLGKALIKIHDYQRAIEYYESALQNESGNSNLLRYELAELYYKLRRYQDAEKLALEGLSLRGDHTEVLKYDVKFCIMLSKICHDTDDLPKAIEFLQKARTAQNQIIVTDVAGRNQSDQKMAVAQICFELGELFVEQKDFDKAVNYYSEAIQRNNTHREALIALARLHLSRNDLVSAQSQCSVILQMNPGDETAALMIGDIMYKRKQHQQAAFHYRTLLEKNPCNFKVMVNCIEMLRRCGKLNEVPQILESAEKMSKSQNVGGREKAGLSYCQGLYYRYINNLTNSVKHFKLAISDAEWEISSTHHVVEILLNPNNSTLGGEVFDDVEDLDDEDEQKDDRVVLKTSLPRKSKMLKTQVLEAYALFATKSKVDIERGMKVLANLVSDDPDYVPALLATSVGHILLKQSPKAKNILKKIAQMEWKSEYADEFENSWLLLADIYIKSNRHDTAQSLLQLALDHNKSCTKALEYQAHIISSSQTTVQSNHVVASTHYRDAWAIEDKSNVSIGYKLALSLLHANKYVEAIDVVNEVINKLKERDGSGWEEEVRRMRIREEVLYKAREGLRC